MNIDSFLPRQNCDDFCNDSDGECSDNSIDRNVPDSPLSSKQQNLNLHPSNDMNYKRKKNNIWSEVLIDQHISTRLGTVAYLDGLKRTTGRGPECYPLPQTVVNKEQKYKKLKNKDCNNKFIISKEQINKFGEQSLCQRRKHVVYRLKKNNGYQRFYDKLKLSDNMDSEIVVNAISKYLKETNLLLLNKIVTNIGVPKALEILCESDAIQRMGGLYTMNEERKRTFGGVYIIMVKIDFSISKQVKYAIFDKDVIFEKSNSSDCIAKVLTNDNDPKEVDIDRVEGIPEDDNASIPSTSDASIKTQSSKNGNQKPTKNGGSKKKKNSSKHVPRLPVEIRRDNRFFYCGSFNEKHGKDRKNSKKLPDGGRADDVALREMTNGNNPSQ